jgi:hypothetical protein
MHTEHLQRVRFRAVVAGWLVGIAATSLLIFATLGLHLIEADSPLATRASISAVAVGFFAGGLFTGLRVGEAPILHGIAIGLLSVVVWFVLNVLSVIAFPRFGWQEITPDMTVALVLVQIVAAMLGARAGYRRVVAKAR